MGWLDKFLAGNKGRKKIPPLVKPGFETPDSRTANVVVDHMHPGDLVLVTTGVADFTGNDRIAVKPFKEDYERRRAVGSRPAVQPVFMDRFGTPIRPASAFTQAVTNVDTKLPDTSFKMNNIYGEDNW